jgi:DNA polymerase III alpha subunit (gram-positive type)
MKYLFLDTECAVCIKGWGKICEFGYVLTDESFRVLDTKQWLLNPNGEFHWYTIKNLLSYKKEEYLAQPMFPEFYQRIRDLLEEKDVFVVAHSAKHDQKYLLGECLRYELAHVQCRIHDIRKPFKALRQEQQYSGVENMLRKLNIHYEGTMHNAQSDAMATMLICKELCSQYHMKLTALVQVKPPPKKKKKKPSKSPNNRPPLSETIEEPV